MTSIQSTPQIASEPQIGNIGGADIITLTMAALGFRTPWSPTPVPPLERIITLEEASWHDHSGDCWIIIYDRVYDITKFLHQHPGGSDVLLENAGRDATVAFRGTGHSKSAILALQAYLIGQLPRSECIYRQPGGITLSDLPE